MHIVLVLRGRKKKEYADLGFGLNCSALLDLPLLFYDLYAMTTTDSTQNQQQTPSGNVVTNGQAKKKRILLNAFDMNGIGHIRYVKKTHTQSHWISSLVFVIRC